MGLSFVLAVNGLGAPVRQQYYGRKTGQPSLLCLEAPSQGKIRRAAFLHLKYFYPQEVVDNQ